MPSETSRSAPADADRLARSKKAYSTRYVAGAIAAEPHRWSLVRGADAVPEPGDVVLARVLELGQHLKLESPVSRRQTLFPGDEVLVAYGHRYAPDQFEADVPEDLGPVQLVAAGGVAGRVTAQHERVEDATTLLPVGLLADATGVVNVADHAPYRAGDRQARSDGSPPVIAVLGTSMNSGKSTVLACLARGLRQAGLRVHAGKATGTGAGGDPRLFADAGAERVLDFTDFGHASTYRLDLDRVVDLWTALVDELAAPVPDGSPDVVLVEIADGIYQRETARLLADPAVRGRLDDVVFASRDALGAVAGIAALERQNLRVAAVSGVVTSSPLAARETAAAVGVPVVGTEELAQAPCARALLEPRLQVVSA